ncbi:sigma-54-dependent transcriptional regulator [Rubellimicrobium aerolatum]|uniref:Sigma-54-dependent transcriptional regulator n=1 Tax=Rubellimicrobium aerolatum TaxID=490979 RepID=A0ABW0SE31_9RHOB|nr:sigma-54 dependent transcriptional regulator [Rubellimicrobium aerolatum]MBP1806826.1 two-component system C4-dicarboxylate transport response regulator DctD [Rubellimicrobium aerolatum]
MTQPPTVLLVDDDESMRHSTAQALELADLACLALPSAEEALARARPGLNGAVVTDIRMPGMDGMTLLARLREIDPELPVILVTGHAEVQLAVDAMRRGAYDFIEKPFATQALVAVLRRALDHRALVLENRRLRAVAGQQDDLEVRLPGRSAAAIDLRRRLRALGPSEADVLVIGPTGAGKEVAARALHDLSPRASRPFVAINCAALPAQMVESELFGHEAGAFPGAMRPRFGRFEHARGGTILLDEVGSMPAELQPRLLRVLQDRAVVRLGSNEPIPLDVRFLATSKVDLAGLVARGGFREDLYWRLAVTQLRLPPLEERREDIPLLFLQLVREAAARHGRPDAAPPPELLADLAARPWPGNVRELRNAAERWVLGLDWMAAEDSGATAGRLADRVGAFERSILAAAIAANGGRLKPVYESLGISRKTLYEKMQKHGLDRHLVADGDGPED